MSKKKNQVIVFVSLTCSNCQLVIYEVTDTCPRCAKTIKLKEASGERALTSEQAIREAAGEREFNDLMLILNNWTDAYIRVLDERGCDWSAPHEFFQEFVEYMLIYIKRLRDEGYATPERMRALGAFLVGCMEDIIVKCEQEEDLMRLTGTWTDNEQEIKVFWEGRCRRQVSCGLRELN